MAVNTIDIKDINFREMTDEDIKYITNQRHAIEKKSFIKRFIFSVFVFIFLTVFEVIGRIIQNNILKYEYYKISTAILTFTFLFAFFNIVSLFIFIVKSKYKDISDDNRITDGYISRLLGKEQIKEEAAESYRNRFLIWKRAVEENGRLRDEWIEKKMQLKKELHELHSGNIPKEEISLKEQEITSRLNELGDKPPITETGPAPKLHKYGSFQNASEIPNYLFFTCSQGNCSTAIKINDKKLFKSFKVGAPVKIVRTRLLNGSVEYSVHMMDQ